MMKYHFLGTKAFKLAAITSIFNLKYYDLKVYLDDNSYFDGSSLFALVCNAPYYGASFMPSPYSIIDDGFIELILVKKINSLNFIKLMPLYKKGKHLSSKYVKSTSFKKARIISDKMLVANCDGEIFKTKELNIEILEKVINLAYIADYNRS